MIKLYTAQHKNELIIKNFLLFFHRVRNIYSWQESKVIVWLTINEQITKRRHK